MSGIAGLRGTGDFVDGERPKDYREGILWYNPNGEAPIFALSAKAGKRVVKDPEFFWWNEGNALVRLRVSVAAAAADTMITVDTADPTDTTMGVNYGTATHLKPGDLLMVEPLTSAAETQAYAPEIIEVDNVMSDTQFAAKRGQAGSTAGAIAQNTFITLIGSAYAEGTGAPRAVTRNPIKSFNYTQIFKNTYELTQTADKTTFRTGDPWSNDKKRKGFDHSRDIELSILFGRRSEVVGENGKPKRTFGGLRTFIPATNTTIFASAVTPNSLIDAVGMVFDYNTGAGDTRMMFVGNQAAIELGKIFNAATNITLNATDRVRVYGIDFQELLLPQGRLLLKTHPLMSRHGIYRKSAFILDFDALKWAPLTGRDTKAKDDVQAEDEDVRRGFYITEAGIEVGYGGLTMAYLGNISFT